ncbi:MAG: mechanosensitive ion channel family protein [Nitrospirales bacterium]|nr:mechanosensitive ion channel family protein [Nitrospira sp.]MDR4501147.1 mechanosensitive ion channel family protein [Nitrospirales bacterium]
MSGILPFPIETLFRLGLTACILVLIGLILRAGLHHSVLERSRLSGDMRRRWSVTIRNTLILISIVGLAIIWAPQLQNFAVSLIAIAVAFVLATKELLNCLIGSFFRTASNAYSVGDRIEINGIRGNVVDHNFLTTTLLEIGPGQTSHQYTGRAIVLPNNQLLNHSLTNETYSKDYRLHVITVPLSTDDDWRLAEHLLLKAAQEECQPYLQEARKKMKALEGKAWLDTPSVEPRVTIQLPEPGHIHLLVRIPCPTPFPSRLEQAILKKFLNQFSYAPRFSGSTPMPSSIELMHSDNFEQISSSS